jgi:Tol biopolymer transport system component
VPFGTAPRIRFLALLAAAGALVSVATSPAWPGSDASHVRDGVIVYEHSGRYGFGRMFAMNATGANPHPLTTTRLYDSCPCSFSPDGKRIVFVGTGSVVRRSRSGDLWTMNADGSHKQRLTFTREIDESDPAWSPNGTAIAFTVTRPGRLGGIWIMDADGRHRRALVAGGRFGSPSWSPDGREIAYEADLSSSTPTRVPVQIYVLQTSGGSPTKLTNETRGIGDLEPTWSPDGRKILFSSDRGDPANGQLDLWTMNPDGTDVQRVTDTPKRDESWPAWSPDGRWIAYGADDSRSEQIYVARPNGSGRRMITHPCRRKCTSSNEIRNGEPTWQPLPG